MKKYTVEYKGTSTVGRAGTQVEINLAAQVEASDEADAFDKVTRAVARVLGRQTNLTYTVN